MWLIAASLIYYGWWNPYYLFLIAISVLFNFFCGKTIQKKRASYGKAILICGIIINLLTLCYYKYFNFFLDTANVILETEFRVSEIILPLAISFFTFQQITYLVDSYRGLTEQHGLLHYFIFVTFFPQLIAGPIVHHSEMIFQFKKKTGFKNKDMAVGLTIFFIGLFKKVVLADSLAVHSSPIFLSAEQGEPISFFVAWAGALGFSFQLYFDFSGYSDMAIGCAKVFGINLPVNFNSPYKATSIIDFWRRWHITLSRFLRDYLYIPLGGNRKGPNRRFLNILVTMLIGGLWHGASWTFVIWGGVHGILLIINHVWRQIPLPTDNCLSGIKFLTKNTARLTTFLLVAGAWVIFRSESFAGAQNMYAGMIGLNGFILPPVNMENLWGIGWIFNLMVSAGVEFGPVALITMEFLIKLTIMFVVVWFFPNTQEILGRFHPKSDLVRMRGAMYSSYQWKPLPLHAFVMAIVTFYSLISMTSISEFLYYQF